MTLVSIANPARPRRAEKHVLSPNPETPTRRIATRERAGSFGGRRPDAVLVALAAAVAAIGGTLATRRRAAEALPTPVGEYLAFTLMLARAQATHDRLGAVIACVDERATLGEGYGCALLVATLESLAGQGLAVRPTGHDWDFGAIDAFWSSLRSNEPGGQA